jgi:hypothetical protein
LPQLRLPPFKDSVVLVPLLAGALAVMYDIGYFSEFDLSYFSFFSLSEHLVFALQALPYAALFSAAIVPIAYNFLLIDQVIAKLRHENNRLGVGYTLFLASIALGSVWASWWWLWSGYLHLTIQLTMAALIVLLIVGIALTPAVLALVVGAAALFLAFVMGADLAREKKDGPVSHIVQFVNGDDWEGVLIRAGEQGLLFQRAPTRQVGIIRWDTVKWVLTKER